MVVSSLLTEAGFESAEKASVETLTEMLQSCEYRAAAGSLPSAPCVVTASEGSGGERLQAFQRRSPSWKSSLCHCVAPATRSPS